MEICPTCCGTGRLTEIACPSTCAYLTTAQAHPPAVVKRQQEHDGLFLAAILEGLPRRQQQLAMLVVEFMTRFTGDALVRLADEDARQAADALAATYETAGRGLIYEHRADSLLAQRLAGEMKTFLDQLGGKAGRMFETDAALVLRRVARAIVDVRALFDEGPATCLEMARRMLKGAVAEEEAAAKESPLEPPKTGGLITLP